MQYINKYAVMHFRGVGKPLNSLAKQVLGTIAKCSHETLIKPVVSLSLWIHFRENALNIIKSITFIRIP